MSLQRSKYLCVEENICLQNIYEGMMSNQFKEIKPEKGSESKRWDPETADPYIQKFSDRIDFYLRFNPAIEVAIKR